MPTEAQAPVTGTAAKPPGQFDLFGTPMLIVLMIVVFYFMILRPQKKEKARIETMRDTMKKGDRVKSIGGILGTVLAVDTTNHIVSVQVDKNVKIDFDRDAIATVSPKNEE